MLYEGDPLRSIGGRLSPRDLRIDQILREVFAAAAADKDDIGAKAIALSMAAHDGEHYVAHVLPLTSRLRRAKMRAYTAIAAIFVHKAELSAPELIARVNMLTPEELRVLLAVAELGGISKAAEALSIAEKTLRTRLHRLSDRVGLSRQADLCKLFAGFARPLIG
jgi:DNA-binding NarL/FixJ family response regulator